MQDMNKFDRVVTILMLLQTKKIVKAKELADRFEVSLRTIYRDLRTLENAGVPIHAEAGIGYSLVDGYNLPPVMFTEDEATYFLIAEKLVSKLADKGTSRQFSAAVSKIKTVLRAAEKEKINNLEKHVLISTASVSFSEDRNHLIPSIYRSIDTNTVLDIVYEAKYNEELTQRKIEPVGIHYYANSWHLIAYCQLRKAYRDFRIDRIREMNETADQFSINHPNLQEFLDKMAVQQDLQKVAIWFSKKAANYARTEKYYHGYIGETEINDGIKMKLLSPSLEGTAHWLLIFTDQIKVLHPPELKDKMKALTKKLVKVYQ